MSGVGEHLQSLSESVLSRIVELAPDLAWRAHQVNDLALLRARHEHWWVPEDIASPPSRERVTVSKGSFTRQDVRRVLNDL